MAKYLDQNGLLYFYSQLKQKFSKIGHTHTISTASSKGVNNWSAGTAPTLGTPFSVTPITKKTVVVGGSTTPIPNISVSSVSIPNVTAAGSAATAAVSAGILTITDGVAPTIGTAISVGSASAGTAIDAYTSLSTGDSVTEGTALSIPNVTSVGTAASLTTENITVVTSSSTSIDIGPIS